MIVYLKYLGSSGIYAKNVHEKYSNNKITLVTHAGIFVQAKQDDTNHDTITTSSNNDNKIIDKKDLEITLMILPSRWRSREYYLLHFQMQLFVKSINSTDNQIFIFGVDWMDFYLLENLKEFDKKINRFLLEFCTTKNYQKIWQLSENPKKTPLPGNQEGKLSAMKNYILFVF